MEETRSGMGGDGNFHDHNPDAHTLEQHQISTTEVDVYLSLSLFDDLRVLDQQEQ